MTQAITIPVIVSTWDTAGSDVDPESVIIFANLPECPEGYTEVARAEVTFTPTDRTTRVIREITMLRRRLAKHRAEAEMQANKMEERINNLLALTHEETANVT